MKSNILFHDLWPTLKKYCRKSRTRNFIVAYIGAGASKLLPMYQGDNLVVDMSIGTVKNGQTNPFEIEKFIKKGVKIYSYENLHAKIYIFDNAIIVASANISYSSQNILFETGLLCRDKYLVASTKGVMRSLMATLVTPKHLKICKKNYRPPRNYKFLKKPKEMTKDGVLERLWIVGTEDIQLSKVENNICNKGEKKAHTNILDKKNYNIESIRFHYKCRLAKIIKIGDLFIEIFNGKHVFPPNRVIGVTMNRYNSLAFVHIERQRHVHTISYTKFIKIIKNSNVKHISRDTVREIKNLKTRHYILGLWTN